MFGNNSEMQERGQVGIGTLIVFIALVLVAAIAAGVLINTAGFLQSQAEATGEESTSQVSNNLNVVSVTGADNTTANDDIDEITLTVAKAAGSGPINLSNVEIQWVNGDSYVLDTSTDGKTFGITPIQGVSSGTVLDDQGDRAEIVIDTENEVFATQDVEALGPGDSATLTLTTADGAQTTVVLNAPDPLNTPTEL
jgi:flagellin FlaB